MEQKKYQRRYFNRLHESELFDSFVNEDDENDDNEEEQDESSNKPQKVTEEQLNIDALKIAVKLAKLMNKVTAEDILDIARQLANYLKNHQVGDEYKPEEDADENPEGTEEKPDNDDNSNDKEPKEEEPSESSMIFPSEDFAVENKPAETGNGGFDDNDFTI